MITNLKSITDNWGDVLTILRNNLPTDEHKHLVPDPEKDNGWKWEPAQRPMIEDIICARTEDADRLWEYLRIAGFEMGVREPRVIHVQAYSRTGMGIEGKVSKVEKRKK